jgi:subfamily B ATP-binding cassette protein MsbA
MREIRGVVSLLKLMRRYTWALPIIIMLGLLSTTVEGIGFYLFVPLFESFSSAFEREWADNPILVRLDSFFDSLPAQSRAQIIVVCIIGSIAVKSLISYSDDLIWNWFEARINYRLQLRLYGQLMHVGYTYLDDKRSGALLNTLETQSWNATEALSKVVSSILEIFASSFFLLLLLMLSWKLTLVVVVGSLAISLIIHVITRRTEDIGREVVKAEEELSIRLWDSFTGLRTVRALGREKYEQARYAAASERAIRLALKQEVISSTAGPIAEVLAALLIGAILLTTLVANPTLLPAMAAFVVLLYRLLPRVQGLISTRAELLGSLGAIDNVLAWLNEADKPYIRSGATPFRRLTDGIVFDRVTFRYRPTERPALRNVSLRIPRGKTTALVGPSGAGKSSVINLLCRFYDVDSGEIRVDNIPLPQLDLDTWRARCAIVSQDVYLFSGSIRENIAYGRLEASDDEVVAAARLASAHEFITGRPQAYDTLVGEGGVRLSGGQRQRIALARAIIRDPEILILDEATNALDAIAEHLVQEALDGIGHERTVVVIAHRLSTIRRADQVIVLDEGCVVEQGDFASLVRANGLFSRLYQLQTPSARVS